MKLNHECVRDVLLYIEKNHHPGIFLYDNDFLESSEFSKYTKEDIEYTLLKLDETEYIHSNIVFSNGKLSRFSTGGLTWKGHEFIDTIRDPKVWSNTKEVVSHLEGVSVSMLSKIGSNIVNHLIDKTMGY